MNMSKARRYKKMLAESKRELKSRAAKYAERRKKRIRATTSGHHGQ
jgi:hypothetical protein